MLKSTLGIKNILRKDFVSSTTFSRNSHYNGRGRRTEYVYFDEPANNRNYYRQGGWKRWYYIWQNMNQSQRKVVYAGGGLFGIFIVSHIQEAPVTKRYRLMITAEWIENMVTKSSFNQVIQEYGRFILPDSHPVSKRVASIMVRLISAAHDYQDPETGERINLFTSLGKSDIPLDKWEFYVIDDVAMNQPSPNAFVIGGGKVFIFRSILPICEDDNGLATVLSHELGHLLADHLGEKLTLSPFFITLNLIFYSIFGSSTPGNLIVNGLVDTKFSRSMETEADYIGLMIMSRSCFNPTRAPHLWENMMKFEQQMGQKAPELLSTHPSSDRRFTNIREWMPKAMAIYENSGCGQSRRFFNYSFV